MIKPETIIHEGNPGPNWLDRCRAVLGPRVFGVLILIIVALAIAMVYDRQHQKVAPVAGSLITSSASSANPLTVTTGAPANTATTASTDSSSNLQPANSAGDAALPGTTTTSSATTTVGPAPTSSTSSLQKQGGSLQQTTQGVQSLVAPVTNLLTGL